MHTQTKDPWYFLNKRGIKRAVPFNFKEGHPKSFHPSDFAIWASFCLGEARLYFSSTLMDAFEKSLKSLIDLSGEKLPRSISCLTKPISLDSWFRGEFDSWGSIFSYLWRNSTHEKEPYIYRIFSEVERDWRVNKEWLLSDGVTPRVFRFDELAYQERSILLLDEDTYFQDLDSSLVSLKEPNIGARFLDDMSSLVVLPPGWGFNENGMISFKSIGRDEYLLQAQEE